MIKIRRATVEDAPEIGRVHIASWQETYRGIVPDETLNNLSVESRIERWRYSLGDPRDEYHHAFVAELDSRILGFANFGRVQEADPEYQGELFAIYLLKSAQNQGLGRSLVSEVAQALLELDIQNMLVWVLAENPARAFYEHLGGTYLREKTINIGAANLQEVTYGWKDLTSLVRDRT